MKYKIAIGNNKFEVEVGKIENGRAQVSVNGESYDVMIENFAEVAPHSKAPQREPAPVVTPAAPKAPVSTPTPTPIKAPSPAPAAVEEDSIIKAPIPGLIMDIKVKVGDKVLAGQTVATMEAMKMENNLLSNLDGTVKEISVQKGMEVATGDVIMIIE
jgi:biotin carboxyl carrier protein